MRRGPVNDERVAYEERTGWPAWIWLLNLFVLVTVWMAVRDVPGASRTAALVAVSSFVALFWLVFGRLRVRVTARGLTIAFGYVPLVRKRVRAERVLGLEAVTYRPIREFGGWGIRFGRDGKRAWTIRGNKALRLEMEGGQSLYVGSDNPDRLGQRIRAAWRRTAAA